MFFSNVVRSKLSSLLRPWLDEEPEIDPKLGFLKSVLTFKNLSLNVSLLNPLIEHSTKLEFRRVGIGEISFRITPWSFPSLVIEVRSVEVTLAPRELGDERRVVQRDFSAERRKEVIAALDPEGVSLHDVLERILFKHSSGNWITMTLVNVVLRCCQILLKEIYVQLQFINESHTCMFKVGDFSLEPQFLYRSSLVGGLAGLPLISRKESVLGISCSCMDFGQRENNNTNWITSLMGLSASVRLHNLKPVDYGIQIPHLNIKTSPAIIPLLLVLLDVLLFDEVECSRSGKELWKIAARRTLVSKLSLFKVVSLVLQWSHYVRAYESLLLMIRCYAQYTLSQNLAKVYSDRKRLSRVKHQLKLVNESEEKLPAEAVASARRIARHSASSSRSSDPALESTSGFITASLLKILALFLHLWEVICYFLLPVVQFSFRWKVPSAHQQISNILPLSGLQFSLSLGEGHATLSHAIISKKTNFAGKPSDLNTSFCFIIRGFCIDYAADISTTSLLVALDELKLHLSSLSRDSHTIRDVSDESLIVLWSNPAVPYYQSEDADLDSSEMAVNALVFTQKHSMRNLWSNWKKINKKHEGINFKKHKQPFVLCELRENIMDPCIGKGGYGFWKCSLAVGKLNLNLEYLSILSIALLVKQVHHYHQWATVTSVGRTHTPTVENSQIGKENRLELYTSGMKVALFNIIPDKNILVGAFIAGPSIQVSLQSNLLSDVEKNIGSNVGQGNKYHYCFVLNIENIELAVWPASKAVFSELSGESLSYEGVADYLWLKEPQKVDIPKHYTNERSFCLGHLALNAYLRLTGLTIFVDDLEVNQQSRIFDPMTISLDCSACREYLLSPPATTNILSVAMCGSVHGAAVLLFMDELWIFLQILEGIYVVSAFSDFEYFSLGYSQDLTRKLITPVRKGTVSNLTKSETVVKNMIVEDTLILVEATLEFGATNIILNDCRRKLSKVASRISGEASSASTYLISLAGKKSEILGMFDLPEFGVGLFIDRSCIRIAGQGNQVSALIDFSGIQTVIFRCQSLSEVYADTFQIRNLLEQSSESSYRFILSKCVFGIEFGSSGLTLSSATNSKKLDCSDSSNCGSSSTHTEQSMPHIHDLDSSSEIYHLLTTRTSDVASGYCLLVDIQLSEISVSAYCMKRLAGCQPNNQEISISISSEHCRVDCNIQGGYIFLDSSALAMFAHCFQAYFLFISNHPLLSNDSRDAFGESQLSTREQNILSSSGSVIGSVHLATPSEAGITFDWIHYNCTVILSHFSLILAGNNGSEGDIQELSIEADMKLKLLDSERKLLFDLNRLTIFTQHQQNCVPHQSNDPLMPHFHSNTSMALPSPVISGNSNIRSQAGESKAAEFDEFQSTESPTSSRVNLVKNGPPDSSYHVSYILKHMSASIMIEKMISRREVSFLLLKTDWVGEGFISGVSLEMTIYQIQMISSLLEPLSGIFGGKGSQDVKQSVLSITLERDTEEDYSIPDGAIVAIKDLHEHVYFAVEVVDNKYGAVGVPHYSLVGERALFRVKYHKGWRSQVSWISFISLFAKNNHGEPLRLNFTAGSGFVEISSSDDKGHALWQTIPYNPKSFEDDDDVKSYRTCARKAFHLVNQKNNCAIAFVDGLPEFVKKPGNPFRVKVFDEFYLTNDGKLSVTCDTYAQEGSPQAGGEIRDFVVKLPCLTIRIDNVALTIFDEISDANGKIPIVRGSINDIDVIGQVMSSKFRIISSFKIAIQYMDAQKGLWSDIVSPVSSSLFYHSRFTNKDGTNVHQGVPAHLFFSMRQVDLSLTQISLDVLLYLVGKLNIAGPFSVQTSNIFPNFCKLENHLGVSLLCHFHENQDVTLAGKQSASVFLRQVAMVNHLPESENSASISLSKPGFFSTSPIKVSMSDGCYFAWRTRVLSLQAYSRSFPGPFIIIEVSQKTEEGLYLGVSPLLRICNESGFSMELQFRRPQDSGECATILLRNGDTVDDSMAVFDALDLSGGSKKSLLSLTLGNFLLSFRPEINEKFQMNGESISIEWSDYLQGEKAVRISGIFDKLNYRFRKVLGVESVKSSFSSLCCPLIVEGQHISDLHFLVRTNARDVPIMEPQNIGGASESATSPIALKVQKEFFIYPTVQVYNLLESEILVHVTENHPDLCMNEYHNHVGKQGTIPCGSSAFFYANPATMYFTVSLTAFNSRCKPVTSTDWVKKISKKKSEVHYIDTELDFECGKYFALLRLSRTDKGFFEVTIFTSYMFQNNTELPLVLYASNQMPLPLEELRKYDSNLPPEHGCFLPPRSTRSWFFRSSKVHIKLLEEKASVALLDLDTLSGFTELCLEAQDDIGYSRMSKLGLSLQPCVQKSHMPLHVVCVVPRYVIANESKERIFIRQCFLQDDLGEITSVEGNQRVALEIRNKPGKRRDTSFLHSILKKHQNVNENSLAFVQFRLKEAEFSWSGSICVASLGRFFLKFKRPSSMLADPNSSSWKGKISSQFSFIEVKEENSSLVLHFYMPLPANVGLPYRIENCLRLSPISYYQKDSVEADTLRAGDSVEYVWDDLNLPHKLVVEVIDLHLVREINIDKICSWKTLFKMRQHKGVVMDLPLSTGFSIGKRTEATHGLEAFKVGYEVYADGPKRVLRICESTDRYKEVKALQPGSGFQFRVSNIALHLLERENNQDVDRSMLPIYSTIIIARLSSFCLDSSSTNQFKYYYLGVQSLNIDEKWQGAPFASMLRRSQIHDSESDENILHIVFIFHSTNSNVREVKYSSIILQPLNLKVDEETLMRLVPFWRTSLSMSRTQSQQFYFKHFEIHPIKITASFLPGSPYSSYNSAQETLRSLLHSVVKVPALNNKVVELNGILLTHAFVTFRELLSKCAQHYSWYIVRAVYIAKGSPLLPPAFASIFDDTASSSLDVFFDPSDGSVSLPGLTLGMFKFISKSIDSKGFFGTKRYFGDLGKTIRIAGSNALFAAVTEISDSILKGAEAGGLKGMVTGFHHGVLRLAMEPSLLGAAVMEGGPDRKIKLDRSPGVDELYIEGYLQAMLDVMYKQGYLRVRVIDNQVILKSLPPNSSVINEIIENVKSFLVSKALLKGDASTASRPLRHLRTESEWRLGPTVLTLCEHLFVSFTIRILRKQANKLSFGIRWKQNPKDGSPSSEGSKHKSNRKWAVGNFVLSGLIAYLDGRLCRHIPHPIARRIVSGFLLSYLDNKDGE